MLSILLSAFFLLLSCVLFAVSLSIPGAGEWDIVGSRAMPQTFIIGMGVCAAVILVLGVIRTKAPLGELKAFLAGGWKRYGTVAVVFASLVVLCVLIKVAGFYPASLLFLLFLQWYLNGRKMNLAVIISSLACPVILYFVFERGLKVIMPTGILF